ncbi:MAG: DUF433 domain-containing protein [Acidobacteriota bacterium]
MKERRGEMGEGSDIYSGADPREIPTYTAREAARYVGLPTGTLRNWAFGLYYPTEKGRTFFSPVIELPDRSKRLLSFMNVVEAHVLKATRRRHGVPLRSIRLALDYLKSAFPSPHPLTDHRFLTDGLDLLVVKYGELIAVSRRGQLAMKEVLEAHLKRIEWDAFGRAERLYPFVRPVDLGAPSYVVIDPRISFGRPVLRGTGIPTEVLAERFNSGESIEDLAKDYARDRDEIEEAIRCELRAA